LLESSGALTARIGLTPAAASAPTPAARLRNFLRENKFMYRYQRSGLAIE
jgi:phage antirepressor YoqD-like protein